MADIDWASVFGALESASLPTSGLQGVPGPIQYQPASASRPDHSGQPILFEASVNAEAGPSRPSPPNRSYSVPGSSTFDEAAFGLFAHDHVSRGWILQHRATADRLDNITRQPEAAPELSVDAFAVPQVPPPTPASSQLLEQYDQQIAQQQQQQQQQHQQERQAIRQAGVFPDLGPGFDFASLFAHSGTPTPIPPELVTTRRDTSTDGPNDMSGSGSSVARPPSTPASSRPTPNTLLDQEDKRVRNTMASAKFRAKKKQHTEEMQRTVDDLEAQKTELEKDVANLKQENGLLREIVQLKYGWKAEPGKAQSAEQDDHNAYS